MNELWLGEQVISQKRFKKFLKHAGQPTRNGIACKHGGTSHCRNIKEKTWEENMQANNTEYQNHKPQK